MASRPPFGKPPFPPITGAFGQSAGPQLRAAPAHGIVKYHELLQREGVRSGIQTAEVNAFLQYWQENELKFAQKILGFKDAPENAVEILKLFSFFRRLGASAQQMTPVFVVVAGLRSSTALSIMHHVALKGPAIAAKLKPLGGALKALGVFITAVEVYNLVSQNKWSEAIACLYKLIMGLAVPWGGAIDALQALLPEASPQSAAMFKILRACDPIGLGGIAVDSFVIVVQGVIDRATGKGFDEERLAKLVNRMKTGPTSFFVEIGENMTALDGVWEIVLMDSNDWNRVGRYTLDQLSDFIMTPSKGGGRFGEVPGAFRRIP